MKKKNSLILDDEFILYCELNKVEDINKLAIETFKRGFTIIKYGETPYKQSRQEIVIEKEVIKEIIKEVPVEKIVEIIKEVPIKGDDQVIIKEIINEDEIKNLKEENKKLKDELDKITKTLENFNKGRFMKNSDLSSLYEE